VDNSISRNTAHKNKALLLLKKMKKYGALYFLISLPILYLILFNYVPMYGVQIAFRDFTPARSILGSPWVGLKHIWRFINNTKFETIMINTLRLSLYGLLTFPLPILFAFLLNYITSARFKKTVQFISYMPHFISVVVVVGMLNQLFDINGPVNMLFGENPIRFLADKRFFSGLYIWSGVWQGIGFSAIIYIAALAGVSQELHEAAIMDGASILKRFWHIDLPSITPTICVLLILQCGSILNVGYEKIFLMQNDLNLSVSEVIATYVYRQSLGARIPQYSYAAAVGLFVSLINVVTLAIANQAVKRFNGYSLW